VRRGQRDRVGAVLGLAILLAFSPSSRGDTQTPGASAQSVCPGAKPQRIPFDETSVAFDSVAEKGDGRSIHVTYCVHVDAPRHDYLVDWPDTNLKDVFTRKTGELSSSRDFFGETSVTSSVVYLGANRTRFDVGALREASLLGELHGLIVSSFHGAVSTTKFHGAVSNTAINRPEEERRETAQPVDLEVSLLMWDNTITISAFDRSPEDHQAIDLEIPYRLRQKNPGLPKSLAFRRIGDEAKYTVDPKTATTQLVSGKLVNSDNQEIGTIPVEIITSGGS
jgi:hypothetical protein